MATLLRLKQVKQSPTISSRTRTCDARCYNASGKDCHCFCKGANHGKGFEYAVDNVVKNKEQFESMGCTLAKAVEQAVAILKQL